MEQERQAKTEDLFVAVVLVIWPVCEILAQPSESQRQDVISLSGHWSTTRGRIPSCPTWTKVYAANCKMIDKRWHRLQSVRLFSPLFQPVFRRFVAMLL